MKIIAKYKCDVCGTEYKDRKDATECENGHKKAKKIIKQVHQHMSGYPLKLEVEMSDGTKLMYIHTTRRKQSLFGGQRGK